MKKKNTSPVWDNCCKLCLLDILEGIPSIIFTPLKDFLRLTEHGCREVSKSKSFAVHESCWLAAIYEIRGIQEEREEMIL